MSNIVEVEVNGTTHWYDQAEETALRNYMSQQRNAARLNIEESMSAYRFEAGETVLSTGEQRARNINNAMREYIEAQPPGIYNEGLIEELKNYTPFSESWKEQEEKKKPQQSKLEFLDRLV